eukprot:gene4912-9796_t
MYPDAVSNRDTITGMTLYEYVYTKCSQEDEALDIYYLALGEIH